MTRRRSSTHIGAWVAVAAAAVIAVAIVWDASQRADVTDERDARQLSGAAVLPVVQSLDEQRDRAAAGLAPDTRQVGLDDAAGPSPEVAAQARDTGEPAFDDANGGSIVIAKYDPAGPTTVAARRAALVGYAISPIDLSETLKSLDTSEGALVVSGPDSEVATSVPAGFAAPEDPVTYEVDLDGLVAEGWRLESQVPSSGSPAAAWFLALAAFAVGALAAVMLARQYRRDAEQEAELLRRQEEDQALAELASVAQASLDLAEVLPASFAVLESALELGGVALLTTGSGPTFVWRDAPSDDEPAVPSEAPVAAGACLAIPLARGGRSLGVMRVRPRRELDEHDVRMLIAAAEIMSSAVANADAYQHQRALITRMQRLDDLKTVFVATASHELRTPVAAITGYASMLVDSWDTVDPDTGFVYAQRVDTNARRLAELVDHLLDFSRLEQGGVYTGDSDLLDLGKEVQELIDNQPHLTPDHDLQLRVEPGLMVSGSKLAIERVVTNLVGNACKYSPAGSTIRVRVSGGDVAHLVVDDEGGGVPEGEREQIFSRFFRGKGDVVVRTRGAGLGLSIVTEFASSMGGEVTIGEAPGGGARFEVTYPLHHATDDAASGPLLSRHGEPDDPS